MYSVQSSDLSYPSLISKNTFPHLCWTSHHSDGSIKLIQMDSISKNDKDQNQNSENQNILNPTSIIDQNESFQIHNKDTLDLTDNFTLNSIVMTEWGSGKITSINKDQQIVKINIEGQEIEYPIIGLTPFLQIYVCIIQKSNIKWSLIKISLNESCYSIKNKVGKMYNVHPSRVILIFKERKIRDYNAIINNLGFYEKAELLAVIRDPVEYCKFRFKNCAKSNFNSKFNSISVKTNVNVLITGIAFYKNEVNDVYYELIIKENKNVIFEADNIFVPKKDENEENSKKETYMVKYNLNKEIIFEKQKIYEIQQNFYNNVKEQYYGNQPSENLADENGVIFTFSKTEIDSNENIKENSTQVAQGLIPGIYYSFK